MERNFSIDFYVVRLPQKERRDFRDILSDIYNSSRKNHKVSGVTVRLQEFSDDGIFIEGELIKIRMENLPSKATLDGEVEPFELAPDEGVGESAAFLFSKPHGILAFQRSRTAPSTNAFARYVRAMAHMHRLPEFLPILREGVLEELKAMKEIRAVTFKVAPDRKRIDETAEAGGSFDSVIDDLQGTFGAAEIEITLSAGHGGQKLKKSPIQRVVRRLISHRATTKKIRVDGKDEQEESTYIDMLKPRVEQDIVLESKLRHFPFEYRIKALREAFKAQQDLLSRYSNS